MSACGVTGRRNASILGASAFVTGVVSSRSARHTATRWTRSVGAGVLVSGLISLRGARLTERRLTIILGAGARERFRLRARLAATPLAIDDPPPWGPS